jgi:hypothetical protein
MLMFIAIPARRNCGVPYEESTGEVGTAHLSRLVIADGLPELLPLLDVLEADVHRCLGRPQRAGCDVESPSVQASHGHVEALPLSAQAIRNWDADILQDDLAGWLDLPSAV